MFQILDNLATHGIDYFPGAPFEGWQVVDARILLEQDNINPPQVYRKLIDDAHILRMFQPSLKLTYSLYLCVQSCCISC
jgi:hypothetical protein